MTWAHAPIWLQSVDLNPIAGYSLYTSQLMVMALAIPLLGTRAGQAKSHGAQVLGLKVNGFDAWDNGNPQLKES